MNNVDIDSIPVRPLQAVEPENTTIAALRRVDVTDANAVHADIAVSQSIASPIVSEQQEFDIRIRARRAEFARNEAEIQALNTRHAAHLQALNAEHAEKIARIVAINENLNNVLNILETANKMLVR